eukprot:m.452319 g.452319  ORF g.452319 m.452319 type:complete len:255 (-) comp20325_c5_seq3:18-782(-)
MGIGRQLCQGEVWVASKPTRRVVSATHGSAGVSGQRQREITPCHSTRLHPTSLCKDLIRCLLVADASKRFDAEQALNHDFIANGGGPCTSVAQLSRKRTLVMLRKFNARRKFKGAIRAVIGGLRLRSSSSWTRAAPDEEHFVLQRAGTKRRRVDEQAPAAVSASALQLKLWFRLGATATRVSITLGECELVDDLRPLVVKRFAAIGSPVPGPFALLWNEGELAADVLVSTVWPSRQGELGPGGSVDTAVVVSPL